MKYSKKFLLDLYETMLKIRIAEESLVEPILEGIIKTPCHLYSGEEAIAVGICAALKKEDYIFGNHRSHGHYIAKGGSLNEMIAEIYCKETGCSRGRGGSMHLICPEVGLLGAAPIVAGTISLAVGSALASKIKGEDRVTVSFFGDGAAGEGVLHECLNFAALKKLPIIFVCENNLYSTHMPIRECRVNPYIYRLAIPFEIKSFRIDGNNVLKVYETAKKAVELCRSKNGPVFIECITYRLRGHVGPDDNIQGVHTDIRSKEEVEKWRKRDPIVRFERFLIKNKIITNKEIEEIKRKIEEEVKKAHIFSNNSPNPKKEEVNKYVFKE
ncbi:thiamine pyrophosphate-dependent dehydrogenase E1 component subunit alpha [Thermodesulfovibrio sp. 3462-1]|uniref:Thiamine pyrophosphate-dependent dehydrogenase E1 component subunit alpha n=1 Tax=Thermodesulfovibrio obliviosus TaxID=3118332 RepID=A0AAU8H5H6_9BACT